MTFVKEFIFNFYQPLNLINLIMSKKIHSTPIIHQRDCNYVR